MSLDLCFLFCDYTTRHVGCQDTCVYYCKGERNLYKTTATRKNLVTGLNGSEWENGFETEKHYELLRLLNSFEKITNSPSAQAVRFFLIMQSQKF